MKLKATFRESGTQIKASFGEAYELTSGGYDEGYDKGKAEGKAEGYEIGKADGAKSEYDRFWDVYQENGEKRRYTYAFYSWNEKILCPKYTIIADVLQGTFMYFNGTEINVDIDARNAASMNSCFYQCPNLKKIKKLIVGENTVFHAAMFSFSYNIEEITFEGTIAMNLAMNISKLTHDSLMSAINCLKDYSGSGASYTLTIGATNLAKLTDAEKAIATQKGWTLV